MHEACIIRPVRDHGRCPASGDLSRCPSGLSRSPTEPELLACQDSYNKALACASIRADFWDALASLLEHEGEDLERATRLRGMAAGARYVLADDVERTDVVQLQEECIASLRVSQKGVPHA